MNKKILILIILVVATIISLVIFLIPKDTNKKISNNTIEKIEDTNTNRQINNIENNDMKKNKVENMEFVYIKVNNHVFNIELEDNSATIELIKRLKNEDIVINAHEYGGFEKVGELGFSLPREDTSITTSAGDVVLYQGNQISLFYDSNSWNYTKLGRIKNTSSKELENILGRGDVTITISLSR